jgi:hypothetical protein
MSLTPSGFSSKLASITNDINGAFGGGSISPVSSSTVGAVPSFETEGRTAEQIDQLNQTYLQQQTQRLSDLSVQFNNFNGSTPKPSSQLGITTSVDWRARLRPKNGGRDLFWTGNQAGQDYLLKPLKETNGLVFQYTPTILISGMNNFNKQDFQGSNFPLVTYKNSTPPDITIQQDFTANTVAEARYLLGVMHFCRVATKSFFGDSAVIDGFYGTPPPIFLFEYLGDHGFNRVPVALASYSIQLPDDVDYVPVKTQVVGSETTYIPVRMNVSITLTPSFTPHKLRKQFDLRRFTTGQAYKEGYL